MKKVLRIVPLVITSLILANCSSQSPTLEPILDQTVVQAQAAKSVKLSMNKENTKETKKSESDLKNKLSKGETKKVEKLDISFTAPDNKNSVDPKSYAIVARIALSSMNGAKSFESGYKLALPTLERLAAENIYIAKVAVSMAKSGMYWETCFKAAAAALENVSSNRENNISETCNLIAKVMSSTKSFEEGAKLGYAAFNIIGQTDNQTVQLLVNTTVNSAKQAKYWEDVYKTLQNGLTELKRI